MSNAAEDLIQRYMARGDLTHDQVQNAALDCLDFMMRAQDAGMEVAVRNPERGRRWTVIEIIVPGLSNDTV